MRDFSRIAASDPTMWSDIFATNREALLNGLDDFTKDLLVIRQLIEDGDMASVHEVLTRAKAARDHFTRILEERKRE